ncbi:hypothetical protein JOM56_015005 [Amanita muscaria]
MAEQAAERRKTAVAPLTNYVTRTKGERTVSLPVPVSGYTLQALFLTVDGKRLWRRNTVAKKPGECSSPSALTNVVLPLISPLRSLNLNEIHETNWFYYYDFGAQHYYYPLLPIPITLDFATIAKAYEVPEMADPFDYHSYDNHTLLQDLKRPFVHGRTTRESSARACRPTRPMLSKVKPHALRALPASVGISGWCLDTLQGSTVGSFRRDWSTGGSRTAFRGSGSEKAGTVRLPLVSETDETGQ